MHWWQGQRMRMRCGTRCVSGVGYVKFSVSYVSQMVNIWQFRVPCTGNDEIFLWIVFVIKAEPETCCQFAGRQSRQVYKGQYVMFTPITIYLESFLIKSRSVNVVLFKIKALVRYSFVIRVCLNSFCPWKIPPLKINTVRVRPTLYADPLNL